MPVLVLLAVRVPGRLRFGWSWLEFSKRRRRHGLTPPHVTPSHLALLLFAFACLVLACLAVVLVLESASLVPALPMVLGSLSDWFGPSIPNRLADDGPRARESAMDSLGSLQNMKEKTGADEVEVDSELARPPYLHVCPHPGFANDRTQLTECCRQYSLVE